MSQRSARGKAAHGLSGSGHYHHRIHCNQEGTRHDDQEGALPVRCGQLRIRGAGELGRPLPLRKLPAQHLGAFHHLHGCAALDSPTEREIQAELKRLGENRTVLMIAHRLSTVVDADEIVVLDQGRVIERGTHAALLTQDGQYAEMWARQEREETV